MRLITIYSLTQFCRFDKLHELNYTFITRQNKLGKVWKLPCFAGHSFDKDVKSSAADRGYTDYPQTYLMQEANKINYIL